MRISCQDCTQGLHEIADGSIDLVVMDPPYLIDADNGSGAFGSKNRPYRNEYAPMSDGITNATLDLICSKLKKLNLYVWCNKSQVLQYIEYFMRGGGELQKSVL